MRDKWMAPQWLACPEIPQYSIGWRMGYGEDYGCRLGNWLDKLSAKEREEYDRLFPYPVFGDSQAVEEDDEELDRSLLYD